MTTRYDNLVVYDIAFPQFLDNRILDYDLMKEYPGAGAISSLASRLANLDVGMITADRYLQKTPDASRVVVLSNEQTQFTPELLDGHGLRGSVCLSGESPIVAWRFYSNLPETAKRYDNLLLFPGARPMTDDKSCFHDFFWPCPDLLPLQGAPWEQRRQLLALVSSNKRAFGWPRPLFELRRPKVSLGRWYRTLEARSARRKHHWMAHDLYLERLSAIRYFGTTDGFDLYGRGWHEPASGADATTRNAIARSYRGPIASDGKLKTLTGYKFTLCFENTIFPGYITEKLFDCLLAGTIPIYLGAPDIDAYVPKDVFIDFRDFKNYSSLDDFLRNMPAEDAHRKIEAARNFLSSKQTQRFTEHAQADLLTDLLLDSLSKVR